MSTPEVGDAGLQDMQGRLTRASGRPFSARRGKHPIVHAAAPEQHRLQNIVKAPMAFSRLRDSGSPRALAAQTVVQDIQCQPTGTSSFDCDTKFTTQAGVDEETYTFSKVDGTWKVLYFP